jgi:hypothetical protein
MASRQNVNDLAWPQPPLQPLSAPHPSLRSDAPAGASRSPVSLLPRSLSPRVHSGDYGEQIAESGYAAAYPGGSTSWLRIEAHLQHQEELVNQPEFEGGGGPSTRILEGRRSEHPPGRGLSRAAIARIQSS